MRWTDVEADWNVFIAQIVAAWPELSPRRLAAIAGDRMEFNRYLAAGYDLTLGEAAEAVDLWLIRVARHRVHTLVA